MRTSEAYRNHDRWVVDCPNPTDTTAWEIPAGQKRWTCWRPDRNQVGGGVGCGEEFTIDWPGEGDDDQGAIFRAQAEAPTDDAMREAARREHEAQHTDPDGEPGDGQDKTNAEAEARQTEAETDAA